MCIILAKKFGVDAPNNLESYIRKAYRTNPDGIGIAVKFRGKVLTTVRRSKDIDLFMQFIDALKKTNEYNGGIAGKHCTFLIHARIGTSGDKSQMNVHPFKIDRTPMKTVATAASEHYNFGVKPIGDTTTCDVVAHNGIVGEFSGHKLYCDTLLLTTMVLSKIPFEDTNYNEFSGRYAVLRNNLDEDVYVTNNFIDLKNGLLASHDISPLENVNFHYPNSHISSQRQLEEMYDMRNNQD